MPQGDDRNKAIAPIVKWAGGKRRLLDRILPLIPEYETYYEPFLGGGAVFFALQPEKAVINDSNGDLMDIYRVIKESPEELIALLQEHAEKDSKDYYYVIRALDRDFEAYESLTDVERAARFLYLNKTCFNGLFRVNRSGEFNVPYGRYKNPEIVAPEGIRAISTYLNSAKIRMLSQDYREVFRGIADGAEKAVRQAGQKGREVHAFQFQLRFYRKAVPGLPHRARQCAALRECEGRRTGKSGRTADYELLIPTVSFGNKNQTGGKKR